VKSVVRVYVFIEAVVPLLQHATLSDGSGRDALETSDTFASSLMQLCLKITAESRGKHVALIAKLTI